MSNTCAKIQKLHTGFDHIKIHRLNRVARYLKKNHEQFMNISRTFHEQGSYGAGSVVGAEGNFFEFSHSYIAGNGHSETIFMTIS